MSEISKQLGSFLEEFTSFERSADVVNLQKDNIILATINPGANFESSDNVVAQAIAKLQAGQRDQIANVTQELQLENIVLGIKRTELSENRCMVTHLNIRHRLGQLIWQKLGLDTESSGQTV